MRFLHLSLRAAAIMLLGCPSASAAPVTPARVQILVEDAASPWSNQGGEGYANDLVRAAFAAVGVDVELKVLPNARCKAMVLQADAVACSSMSASPELGNLSEPGPDFFN
jgi:polar amino acid transport system substrate-binding protein